MVWAICGRMPLMMQSAPISRAAATVLSRCCATSVSTVGTPVMSMMAMPAPVVTICCSRLSITTCVRALSSVPMSGSASIALPQLDHRGRKLHQLLLLPRDDLFARFLVDLRRVETQLVQQQRWPTRYPPASPAASFPYSWRRRANSGSFSEKTNMAVSRGRETRLRPGFARSSYKQVAHRPPSASPAVSLKSRVLCGLRRAARGNRGTARADRTP